MKPRWRNVSDLSGGCECANCSMRVPIQTCTAHRNQLFFRGTTWLCGICQQDYKDFCSDADKNRLGLTTLLLATGGGLVIAFVAVQLLLARGLHWICILPLALPVVPYVLRNDLKAFLKMNKVISRAATQTEIMQARRPG